MAALSGKEREMMDRHALPDAEERVLLACSGGLDSMTLFHLFLKSGQVFSVCHVNHGLRENASRDEAFVREACLKAQIPCIVKTVDVRARVKETHESVEEAARVLRFHALREAANACGARVVALAHHANDRAETILFHMLRGTGLKGLSGMEEKTVRRFENGEMLTVIRPLLRCTRAQIRAYAEENGLQWVEDETNEAEDATRNILRRRVIPGLLLVRHDAVEKIAALGGECLEIDGYLRGEASAWLSANAEMKEEEISYPAAAFAALHPVLREYVAGETLRGLKLSMKDKGRVHLDALSDLSLKASGKEVFLSGGGYAVKRGDRIFVMPEKAPENTEKAADPLAEWVMETRIFPYREGEIFPENTYTKWFDYDKIKERIVFRTRESGDVISTAPGMHKKLKDFLIDEKIPRETRDRIPLVTDGKNVLWAVGYRMSAEYKLSKKTTTILEITVRRRSGHEG